MRSLLPPLAALLVLCLGSHLHPAHAGDSRTAEEVARDVLAAVQAGSDESLSKLASQATPDPWLVADELCRLDERAAAVAFASATPERIRGALGAWVASYVVRAGDTDLRRRIEIAEPSFEQGEYVSAWAQLEEEDTPASEVLAIRFRRARGLTLNALRRNAEAVPEFQAAADTAERVGWLGSAALSCWDLGVQGYVLADFDLARRAWKRALDIQERRGSKSSVARILGFLGQIASRLGEHAEAVRLHRAALDVGRETHDPDAEERALRNLGISYRSLGRLEEALEVTEESITLNRGAGNREGESFALGVQGSILLALGRLREAREALQASARLKEELGGRERMELNLAATITAWAEVEKVSGDLVESLRLRRMVLELEVRLGADPLRIATAEGNLGALLADLGEHRDAVVHQERSLEGRRAAGDRAGTARTLANLAGSYLALGDPGRALEAAGTALDIAETLPSPDDLVLALVKLSEVLQALGRLSEAQELAERAVSVGRTAPDRRRFAAALLNQGRILGERGGLEPARRAYDEVAELADTLHDQGLAAAVLSGLGTIEGKLGDRKRSAELHGRAADLYERAGARRQAAVALSNLAGTLAERGAFDEAREALDRAAALTHPDDRDTRAATRAALGIVLRLSGDLQGSKAALQEAANLFRELGQEGELADVFTSLGTTALARGDVAAMLRHYEAALAAYERSGSRRGLAVGSQNLAAALNAVGDIEGAIARLERARTLFREMGSPANEALVLLNLAGAWHESGRVEQAVQMATRARDLAEDAGRPRLATMASVELGAHLSAAGRYEAAVHVLEDVLPRVEALGSRDRAARVLANLGNVRTEQRDAAGALAYYDRAATAAEASLDADLIAYVAGQRARSLHQLGRFEESLAASLRALDGVRAVSRELTGTASAGFRERFWPAAEAGVAAAVELDRPTAVLRVIELIRAADLATALANRDAVLNAALPPPLAKEVRESEAQESSAAERHRRMIAAGQLKAIRQARESLERAQRRREDAIRRVRSEARRVAEVTFPAPLALDELRSTLREDEALVLYFFLELRAMALVVTREGTRLVPLGAPEDIERAADLGPLTDEGADWKRALAPLRELVIEPLGLSKAVRHILVSPDGPLASFPLNLLVEGMDVAYVPSATTFALLRDGERPEAQGVLALGDPDYEVAGGTLDALPATRLEAEAVGDVVLLGRDATQAGLAAALGGRAGWHAVHLACHGLVDSSHPLRSALALTPDEDGDGTLSMLEVFLLHVPADVVVLSACDTGRGAQYRAEGLVGFAQAFFFAGASRVLCSLWKVDDEATRALMVHFYERWNGPPGRRLGAAAALREAQRFVREDPDHPEWAHPRYWAAWVLWGLP